MATHLQPNELVAAIRGPVVAAFTKKFLEDKVVGSTTVFDKSGCGLSARLDLDFDVTQVDLELDEPHFKFNDFEIDLLFRFRLGLNFGDMYDCIGNHVPLPPRCIEICIPFTDICYEECIPLGSVAFPLPIPVSIDVTGLYRPAVYRKGDEWHVYPKADTVLPPVIDAARIIERISQAIANELPWPLDRAAGALINLFGKIFDFLEDAISQMLLELAKYIFETTGGWNGIELKMVKIVSFPATKVPGTGKNQASDPEDVPVPLDIASVDAKVNDANELEVRAIIRPA